MVVEARAEAGGAVRLVGSPFETGAPAATVAAAPMLGHDTDEVLAAAGYGAEARAALRAQGIIA